MQGYFEFEVSLRDLKPRIWRRFLLAKRCGSGLPGGIRRRLISRTASGVSMPERGGARTPDVYDALAKTRGVHRVEPAANEDDLLNRISIVPGIFGGKPIIRGRRLAVEHVLGMLAAGDDHETILDGYPWLEPEDIQACLVYAHRLVGHERVEPPVVTGDE